MKERADVPEWEVTIDAEGRVAFAHPKQARAWLKRRHAGEVIVAQFYPHDAKRTDPQNRALHALVSAWLAEGPESKGGWTIDGLKLFVLGEVFGRLELAHPVTGEVIYLPNETSTARLSKAKFCKLIEGVLEMAAEQDGIYLEAPDQYRKAKEQERRRLERLAQKGQAA